MLGAGASAVGARLADLDRRTGHQLVVAAFQSLDGESLEDYTNRLFRAWKIGSARRDDGALFALFVKDRRWRVEVGYGLEPVLTDLEAAEIARDGVPYFQRGDYAGGVSAVVDGLIARITRAPGAPLPRPRRHVDWWEIRAALLILFFILRLSYLISDPKASRAIGREDARRRRRALGSSWWGWSSGGGGWGGGGFGGGGFSGGGGSSGGGGASGGW